MWERGELATLDKSNSWSLIATESVKTSNHFWLVIDFFLHLEYQQMSLLVTAFHFFRDQMGVCVEALVINPGVVIFHGESTPLLIGMPVVT